jgi:hypothetical protein
MLYAIRFAALRYAAVCCAQEKTSNVSREI